MDSISYIIGIDAAFRNMGLCLFDKDLQLIDFVVLTTKPPPKRKNLTRANMLAARQLLRGLESFCRPYIHNPSRVVIVAELPSGSQSSAAANLLGYISGIVVAFAWAKEIRLEAVHQGDIKKWATGSRQGDKEAIMERVTNLLSINTRINRGGRGLLFEVIASGKVEWLPKIAFEHLADAIAAVHFAKENGCLLRKSYVMLPNLKRK